MSLVLSGGAWQAAKASRAAVVKELAEEEAATDAKLAHVDSMVDELRKLTKGKLPFWLEKELELEAAASASRKKMAKEAGGGGDGDAGMMASFAAKALATED